MIYQEKKPYKGARITITHKTGLDLSNATFEIKCRKPDGTTIVTLTASRIGTTDKIRAYLPAADNDAAGEWRFQSFVRYSAENIVPCKTQYQYIYDLYN